MRRELHYDRVIQLGLPTIGTENTGRIKPSARRSRRRRRRGELGLGRGFSLPSEEGLCPSPEKFSNFCLEIACYGSFWKQFLRPDSSAFTSVISVSDSLSCKTITRPIFISHQSCVASHQNTGHFASREDQSRDSGHRPRNTERPGIGNPTFSVSEIAISVTESH